MFRSSNPAFRSSAYAEPETWDRHEGIDAAKAAEAEAMPARPTSMTVQGTVNKTFFLLALTVTTAIVGWNGFLNWGWNPMAILFGGMIGGFAFALVCIFAPRTSPVAAPLYALAEGVFLGGISAWYAMRFSTESDDGGIVLNTQLIFNAMLVTFGILAGMLVGYRTKLIRPGPVFRKVWITLALGTIFYFLIAMVAGLFGSFSLLSVYDPSNGGMISILFSLLLVGLASTALVLDFQMVEIGVRNRAPRYMEWYSGFALLLSLVWLYLEVLRLLAKLQSRD